MVRIKVNYFFTFRPNLGTIRTESWEGEPAMTTGEKIKRIRQHRGMTQKELGDAVGLTANRIAQYEMGYRVPKAALLEKMVEAFNVSRECLLEENGMAVAMLEQLFWLDEEMPGIIKLAETSRSAAGYNTNSGFSLQYDDNDDWPARPPVAMWFDFTILDDFLRDWAKMQRELRDGELSREQYFEWKIRWPEE